MEKPNKTEAEWQLNLDPEAFRVTRQCGTEPPFSGQYYYHHEQGVYCCICCHSPLFSSETKYESGSGWPSFWQPLPGALRSLVDQSLGMTRTEVKCAQCDAHLGHVFEDGPQPSGLRYCINSVALDFGSEK